jgi:hypothetical protein
LRCWGVFVTQQGELLPDIVTFRAKTSQHAMTVVVAVALLMNYSELIKQRWIAGF